MRFLRSIALAAILFTFSAASALADPFALHDGDRVVLYGDSITAQQLYTNDAEAFVLTRFPTLKIDWYNAGWGGDRVTGGAGGPIDVRVKRDMLAYKPTRVTIMLGMNDGSYRAFDDGIFDTYKKGYQHILDSIKSADATTKVTLIQPSPYDDVTNKPKFDPGYNSVLVQYGNWLKTVAQSQGLDIADFNSAVVAMLQKAVTIDPEKAKAIIPDRVHPSYAGHLVMAETLVRSWNFPQTVSEVAIDAKASSVLRQTNATVTKVTAGANVSWDCLENALPLPVNYSDTVAPFVIQSSDFLDAIDQEIVKVANLSSPKYDLRVDGNSVGTFTSDQLAAGVNIASLPTPMLAQAQGVMMLVNQHVNVHGQKFRGVQAPMQNNADPDVQKALAGLLSALDAQDAAFVAKARSAAQPTVHHFQLVAAQ